MLYGHCDSDGTGLDEDEEVCVGGNSESESESGDDGFTDGEDMISDFHF